MKPSVSVISVNWNSGVMIKNCIDSVLSCGDGLVDDIIVVDNDSQDNSIKYLSEISGVSIVCAVENLGFGRACNLGAKNAKSDYLLFLNPDACLHPGALQAALGYMESLDNADVGICGVQLVDESGNVSHSCARFPTIWSFIAYALGLDRLFRRVGYFMSEWAHDSIQDVDHVIGAFFLVRSDLFKTLNGFDERFFVYLEDLDFSYRARQAGWRSVYLANVQAFHAGGGTSNQVKARRLFYSLRSRLLYAFKHFSWVGAVLVMLITMLVEPISRSALAVVKRSWPSLKETWQGYGMLWRWLPQWWFKGITR